MLLQPDSLLTRRAGHETTVIGASLSEPHINSTALHEIYVYMHGTTVTFRIYAYSNLANCEFTLV